MQKNFLTNTLNNKNNIKLIQKAILTGIGVAASKDSIKKAASGIYNDVQKIILDLLEELEERGEIKTKETKDIIKKLQKKSEIEKTRIFKKIQKEGKILLKSAREIVLTPVSVLKEAASTLISKNKNLKSISRSLSDKRSKKTKKKRR